VFAAELAKRGYQGPEAIFEGKEGFVDTFGGEFDLDILTRDLGKSFRILECSMKAFPTEALTHSPITAALDLVHEHKIHPEEVKHVVVHTIERAKDILADPSKYKPTTKETADHSLPYVIAAAIADGKVTPDEFEPEKLQDPKIWELLPKIEVVADPKLEAVFPELKAAIVEIETNDGRKLSRRVDYPKGDYRSPMSADELAVKFNSLANPIFSDHKQRTISDAIWHLDEFASIREFMGLLVSDKE
jgi:2-methylcitrate dehydratase